MRFIIMRGPQGKAAVRPGGRRQRALDRRVWVWRIRTMMRLEGEGETGFTNSENKGKKQGE